MQNFRDTIFPAIDGPNGGVKFAFHTVYRKPCTTETIARDVTEEEINTARDYLSKYLPELAGKHLNSATCIYTSTPDNHFIIGAYPSDPRITIAAGFSGHGFKFASVIGKVLAEIATTGSTQWDISMFNPCRVC